MMAKSVCWAACCLLLAAPALAADDGLFKVRVNRLQGVLDFAYSYCGGPYESAALQQVLESAGHRSGEPLETMVHFCGLDIHRTLTKFPGRPPVYDTGGTSAWNRFTRASVTSASMADLVDATADVFTFEEQGKVIDAMRELEPLYRRLIEEPHGERAATTGQALSDYLRAHDVESMMQAIAHLYSVPWPQGMPLWIGLSPTPAGEGSFSATINGNVVRSFMPADYRRLDIYAGVMAHEFAHVLFSNLTMDAVQEIQGAFLDARSPARRFAEAWLNEALATAAGNAWVYRQLNGEHQQGEWYSDPVVDAYAKAMAPPVHAVLDAGGRFDEALVETVVEAFDRAFPNALDDPAVVLPHAMLVVDAGINTGATAVIEALYRQRVEVRALHVESPEVGDYVPGISWPTVLRVQVSGLDADPAWRRRVLADGGLEFSVQIADAHAFGDAFDQLLARIHAADW